MKCYGIGLSKTGTKSLAKALDILNGNRRRIYCYHGWNVRQIVESYASTDVPTALRYKALAELFSKARFILTIRDIDEWLESLEAHVKRDQIANAATYVQAEYLTLRWQLLGFGRTFDQESATIAYHRHLSQVTSYFQQLAQRDRLLIYNLCGGEGWEPLCNFLGKPIPPVPFPHIGARQLSQ